ncbi:hypothetical protein [Parasitella parasitica]|uniref:J domain-containing protein n=1 Tax=Parasitella parasitica TaxID=35722 RepID=A0A0B7NQE8_9FUNG|nr:hypothetical protein [Parasitella parasitica]
MVEHLYKALGLQHGATLLEIKKAKEYHPDKNKEGAEKFKEISNAYSILCDSEKLSEYKRKNPSSEPTSASSYAGAGANGFEFPFDTGFFHFDFGYNSQPPPPPPPRNPRSQYTNAQASPPPPERPPRTNFDIRTKCSIELEDIYNGRKINLEYEKELTCNACKNERKQPNLKRYKECDRCGGSGLIKRYLDSRKAQTPIRCVFCKGSGKLKYYLDCQSCKGVHMKKCSTVIKTPKGVHDGQTLNIKGRGYLKPDRTKGSLRVEVDVLEHPVFKREGDNLRITTKISLKEAIMGFVDKKLCTHLDGRKVLITQMCGYTIRPHSQRRLPGEGMPIYGSKTDGHGDLIVTFDVEWQDTIQIPPSKAARDAINDIFQTNEHRNGKENVIIIEDDEGGEDLPANDQQANYEQPPAAATQTPSISGTVLDEKLEEFDGLDDTWEGSEDLEQSFDNFMEARSSFCTQSDTEDMPMSDAASFVDGSFEQNDS